MAQGIPFFPESGPLVIRYQSLEFLRSSQVIFSQHLSITKAFSYERYLSLLCVAP